MKHLRRRAAELLRAVAPEVPAPYIVLSADLGIEGHYLAGCVSPTMDLVAKPWLERRGAWRGRGAAILLDPAAVAGSNWRNLQKIRRRDFGPSIFGTLLHELAHLISEPSLIPSDSDPVSDAIESRAALAKAAAGTAPLPSGRGAPVPFTWHGAAWIRIALHLRERAVALGYDLSIYDVADTSQYSLSSTRAYCRALGDEPSRLAGAPIADIPATPMPEAFAELWRDDLARWAESNETNAADVAATLSHSRGVPHA